MLTLRRSRRLEPGCPWTHQACSCRVPGKSVGRVDELSCSTKQTATIQPFITSLHCRLDGSSICPLLLWISEDCGGTAHIHQLANQGRIILAHGRKPFIDGLPGQQWTCMSAQDWSCLLRSVCFHYSHTHTLQHCSKPDRVMIASFKFFQIFQAIIEILAVRDLSSNLISSGN